MIRNRGRFLLFIKKNLVFLLDVCEQKEEVRSSTVEYKENIIFSMTILILEMVFKGEIPLKIF